MKIFILDLIEEIKFLPKNQPPQILTSWNQEFPFLFAIFSAKSEFGSQPEGREPHVWAFWC